MKSGRQDDRDDGQLPAEMALAYEPSERLRGGLVPLGEVHRRGAVHHGRVPDPCAQVHIELVQHLFEQRFGKSAVFVEVRQHSHIRRVASGDHDEGFADFDRVHV